MEKKKEDVFVCYGKDHLLLLTRTLIGSYSAGMAVRLKIHVQFTVPTGMLLLFISGANCSDLMPPSVGETISQHLDLNCPGGRPGDEANHKVEFYFCQRIENSSVEKLDEDDDDTLLNQHMQMMT